VARIWFSKIRVRDDGRVDPHHRHETAKLAQKVQHVAHAHRGNSVVVAAHRFAERRLLHLGEWWPEQRDLDALRAVVNTKAGRVML
jgi:hypothetical protein